MKQRLSRHWTPSRTALKHCNLWHYCPQYPRYSSWSWFSSISSISSISSKFMMIFHKTLELGRQNFLQLPSQDFDCWPQVGWMRIMGLVLQPGGDCDGCNGHCSIYMEKGEVGVEAEQIFNNISDCLPQAVVKDDALESCSHLSNSVKSISWEFFPIISIKFTLKHPKVM